MSHWGYMYFQMKRTWKSNHFVNGPTNWSLFCCWFISLKEKSKISFLCKPDLTFNWASPKIQRNLLLQITLLCHKINGNYVFFFSSYIFSKTHIWKFLKKIGANFIHNPKLSHAKKLFFGIDLSYPLVKNMNKIFLLWFWRNPHFRKMLFCSNISYFGSWKSRSLWRLYTAIHFGLPYIDIACQAGYSRGGRNTFLSMHFSEIQNVFYAPSEKKSSFKLLVKLKFLSLIFWNIKFRLTYLSERIKFSNFHGLI